MAEKHWSYDNFVVARLSIQIKGIEVMEAVISRNAGSVAAVGGITKLEQFPAFRTSKLAEGLPADFPMLRCPIADKDAHFIPVDDIHYRMRFCEISEMGAPLMAMLFQINGVQIYWLADLEAPEVWAAYDKWKCAGRVPILLDFDERNERDCTLCVPEIPMQPSPVGEPPRQDEIPAAAYVWLTMETVVASDVLQYGSVSGIADFRLERVLVNLLATKRLEPFFEGRLHGAKPKAT